MVKILHMKLHQIQTSGVRFHLDVDETRSFEKIFLAIVAISGKTFLFGRLPTVRTILHNQVSVKAHRFKISY